MGTVESEDIASNFAGNRKKPRQAIQLFIQVLEYIAFCYGKQKADNVKYSKKEVLQTTYHGDKVENFLNKRLVSDYLQKYKSKFPSLKKIPVFSEYSIEYQKDGLISEDIIDIAFIDVLKKGFKDNIQSEEKYFVIECKRVNKMNFNTQTPSSNISEYIKEITKLLENRQYKHRFSFEGMIGYIENSQKGIDEIIKQIDSKLDKDTTIQNLQKFDLPNSDFKYCRLSKHKKQDIEQTEKEIYHLFLDYSQIITA